LVKHGILASNRWRFAAVARTFDIENRLIRFACSTCQIAEDLPSRAVGRHIASQLIRCGTAPAANYGEAQGAESRRDFVHKLKICLKELREVRVWLLLIVRLRLIDSQQTHAVLAEADELISIMVASIRTAQRGDARTS
jgi:four helix bundle protein